MIYNIPLTIPTDTAIASPVRELQRTVSGEVVALWLTFPPGCAGLVGVRILWGTAQIWPTNQEQWFVADGITFNFPENFEVARPRYNFVFEGYNLDCLYPHTIYFRMVVLKQKTNILGQILNAPQIIKRG